MFGFKCLEIMLMLWKFSIHRHCFLIYICSLECRYLTWLKLDCKILNCFMLWFGQDVVAETAMQWTKVLRTGAIEAKFMGIDLTTIMFNMDRGQNIAEVSLFSTLSFMFYETTNIYIHIRTGLFTGGVLGLVVRYTISFHEFKL